MKECWIRNIFSHVISKRKYPVDMLNHDLFLQLALDDIEAEVQLPHRIGVQTASKTHLYFHVMFLMRKEIVRRKLNIVSNAGNSTLTSMTANVVQKACDRLANPGFLGPSLVVIQPYLWFNPAVIPFQELSQRPDGFGSLKQQETFFEASPPL